MLKLAVFAVFAGATLAMLYAVTDLANLLAAKHRQRKVTYVRMLQVMGAWQLSVGLVIIVSGGWYLSVAPFGLGLAMLLGGSTYARWTSR
jgi:hypothetical protein